MAFLKTKVQSTVQLKTNKATSERIQCQIYLSTVEREQVREMNISQLKLNLHLILLADCTDREPAVTFVAVQTKVVPGLADRYSSGHIERVERTRPIPDAFTSLVGVGTAISITRFRKDNGVTVYFTCYFICPAS